MAAKIECIQQSDCKRTIIVLREGVAVGFIPLDSEDYIDIGYDADGKIAEIHILSKHDLTNPAGWTTWPSIRIVADYRVVGNDAAVKNFKRLSEGRPMLASVKPDERPNEEG